MSAAGTTARVRREQRRAALSRSLRDALDAAGCSHTEAGALVGVDRSTVDRWADAHDVLSISVADLAALPLSVRRALVGEVTPELALVELPSVGADLGCDLAHATEAHRESAEAVAVALAAVADGHVSADEGARLVAECDQAISALLRLRALGQTAVRERVIAARRPLRAVGR